MSIFDMMDKKKELKEIQENLTLDELISKRDKVLEYRKIDPNYRSEYLEVLNELISEQSKSKGN